MEELLLRATQPRTDIQVGSGDWLRQHDAIERLNIQAHQSAQCRSDEYTVDALVTHGRLSHLVHELLVAEAWGHGALPLLGEHLAKHVDSILWQPLLAQEALLCNFLEVALYQQHACAALSEDALMELGDYCQRKLIALNSAQRESKQGMLHQEVLRELQDRQQESQFYAAMSTLTILRYLTDHMESLPLGIMSRIVTVNDSLLVLVFEDGAWVQSKDSLKLDKHPAQVWLAILNILTGAESKSRALASSARCSAALRLRPLLTDILMDQLPVLKNLRRVLDELMLGCMGTAQDHFGSCLILEQVPTMREGILRGMDWSALAQAQRESTFGAVAAAEQTELRKRSLLTSLDALCAMEPDVASREDAGKGPSEEFVSVSVWRALQNGVLEPWADFKLSVDASKPAEMITVKGSDGSGKDSVKGSRSRLKELSIEATRPLPATGKVAVVFGQHSTECRLSLPAATTKESSASELAAHGWLTVGNLAADGFALQLKLRRVAKPQVRDKDMGEWLCYHPTGGAITVLCDSQTKKVNTGPRNAQSLNF
ncbi:g6272 [Coccomyxa viridis]|uniref:G6272 protein n=1 Tax=Coccomyxa viridis TaxID=1274662 RepID=A0ABP1G013_9CHLO